MGIVYTTAYPSRVIESPPKEVMPVPNGRFHLEFDTVRAGQSQTVCGAVRQRQIAELLGKVLHQKPQYDRSEHFYRVGKWTVVADDFAPLTTVTTERFDGMRSEQILMILERMRDAGYVPIDEITILYEPDAYDARLVLNLCNIMEARNHLIAQALGIAENIQIMVSRELAFSIPLDVFSFVKLEACICLLQQASIQAATVGKARMKPCDLTNAKYQMRTWLLRLGFIGEAFARPRQTLLSGLDGDCAFYDENGKEKAAMKRKAKRMAG